MGQKYENTCSFKNSQWGLIAEILARGLITSQLPVSHWHEHLNDETLADAILDRIVHNSIRLELQGESMRKIKKSLQTKTS